MGAMIDAWLLGWLGGQQGCRCQQKYITIKYRRRENIAGASGLMPQTQTGIQNDTNGHCMPGSAVSRIPVLYAVAGQARHAMNHCLLRIVALALGLLFFALGFGLGSHLGRSGLLTFAFFGFGFLAGRLGGLVFICRSLA